MSELLTPDERGHLAAAYKASRLESQDVGLYTAEVLKGVPALLRDVERLHAILDEIGAVDEIERDRPARD